MKIDRLKLIEKLKAMTGDRIYALVHSDKGDFGFVEIDGAYRPAGKPNELVIEVNIDSPITF